jgi:hypothetical protein
MKLLALGIAVVLSAGAAVVTSDELDKTFESLKEAQGTKDAAQIKKLAVELHGLTSQVIAQPAPAGEDEKAAWTNRVAYAKELAVQAEYAISVAAIAAPPAVAVDLWSTLEQQNPKSTYLDDGYARYFYVLNQTKAAAKIPAIAEKALPNFPENEDLLLVLADNALSRKASANALTYARRLVNSLTKHPKPEGVDAAYWEKKKTASLGRGYWIAGMVLSEQTQYFEADKNLRSALPLIKGNDAMLAPALYYLGVADFQLGKQTLNKGLVLEAAKYSDQAAAYAGPYQQHAVHNSLVMKQEAAKMR